MKLVLSLPLYFAEELESFNIVVGIASSMKLPEIILNEVYELSEIILEPNYDELADYFSYD